eukprot:TRINITY_DN10593_c0_g1_i3.p1 TRINITY_DN10593_c0_g1~~TRINITY_DN10593_c0_g1_i3.p1  ORF type:complete len:158 (+),score=30.56 TRINITY_DN10593_c0_g1_i3:332-805(+)
MKRMDLIMKQIRGLSCSEAITQLQFIKVREAQKVKEFFERSRLRAKTELKLDPDRLLVCDLYVTKGNYPRAKPKFKGHGKVHWIQRRTCHVFLKLKEVPTTKGILIGRFNRGVNKAHWAARKYQLKLEIDARKRAKNEAKAAQRAAEKNAELAHVEQ